MMAGLGVVLDPIVDRWASNHVEPIFFEVEQNHIADYISVIIACNKLLAQQGHRIPGFLKQILQAFMLCWHSHDRDAVYFAAVPLRCMQREMHTHAETIAFLMNAMYTVKPALPILEFQGRKAFDIDLERSVSSYAALPGV
jgi:hypothetical protein